MSICGVYEIKIGEWFYIGSSKDIDRRIKDHKVSLIKGIHKNKFLQFAYNDCKTFDWKILVECEEDSRYEMEQRLIQEKWEYPNRANISAYTLIDDPGLLSKIIAHSTSLAYKMRPELGQSISQNNKEHWLDPCHREKRTNAIRQANLKQERRDKISQSLKRHWSNEQTRISQSEIQQKSWTDKKRQEHSETMRQAWNRQDTREKASDSAKTKWKSDAYASNQSQKQSKSWQDPDIRKKRLEGQRLAFERRRQERLNNRKED